VHLKVSGLAELLWCRLVKVLLERLGKFCRVRECFIQEARIERVELATSQVATNDFCLLVPGGDGRFQALLFGEVKP